MLPRAAQPPTLSDLKTEIAAITSIPYEQIKLVVGGLVMKEDKAQLARYGLKEGSRVMLIGTAGGIQGDTVGQKEASTAAREAQANAARLRKQKEEDQSEGGLLRRIGEIVNNVKTDLLPEVEQLSRSVEALAPQESEAETPDATSPADAEKAQADASQPAANGAPADSSEQASSLALLKPEQISLAHRKLSELLLRCLLSLDGVQVNSDTTRSTRKAAVRDVQALLDRVDAEWSKAKSLGVRPT